MVEQSADMPNQHVPGVTVERCDLMEVHNLCRLCLCRCNNESKQMHKTCRWKGQFRDRLCLKLNKCRRSHHRLLHVDAEGERNLRMAKPAELLHRPPRSLACD